MDPETGLYYYRLRQYDPKAGRFTRKDLWRGSFYQPLSLNRYIYCCNNPVILRDPWGLDGADGLSEGTTTENGVVEGGGGSEGEVEFFYSPPGIPIEVSINNSGQIKIKAGAKINTPIGTFGIKAIAKTPNPGTKPVKK